MDSGMRKRGVNSKAHSLRSDSALMEEAYSEGVIPEIFLNCLEK